MTYIKQLDALRGLAVLLVIISHWLPKSHVLNTVPNGKIGVDIFFVLSGFLISGILLNSRKMVGTSMSILQVLKHFYIRRSLRIFPVYYLYILILFLLGFSVSNGLIYYVTYTANFHFYNNNSWAGTLSHLWSLCVEEQFYIIWPFIILLIPREYLLSSIYTFISIGVVSQIIVHNNPLGIILPFTCFDSFGMGALLAYYYNVRKDKIDSFERIIQVACFFVIPLLVLYSVSKKFDFLPLRTLISLFSLLVITKIVRANETNIDFLRPLNNFILQSIGEN
ncbi:MAG: acyltransferase family protein [Chitinophagaceae bacterium]